MRTSMGQAAVLAALLAARSAAAAPAAADRTGTATVNGLRMYYEEHGSGPPLVLLHGGGSTAQTSFGAIIPTLARTHHVIAPEQQAHGHSGDRPGPLSFEQMADDTAALLGQLGVARADVLAFSNGGVVAMQLAIRHPGLVRRLILCSSFYARSGMPPQFWQGFAHATMDVMPPPLRAAFVAAAPDAAEVPVRFAKQVALMGSFRDLPEASLRGIAARTLVMIGDRDVMSVEHDAQLARLLPHAELAVMPGSAHGAYLGAAEIARPGSPLVGLGLATIEAFLADKL
ncbi:MAG TPA: alpha/beta hydrolase [Polyangia bacterium]|nr:alpha/beta hydrolase [Polyangia bacterium]